MERTEVDRSGVREISHICNIKWFASYKKIDFFGHHRMRQPIPFTDCYRRCCCRLCSCCPLLLPLMLLSPAAAPYVAAHADAANLLYKMSYLLSMPLQLLHSLPSSLLISAAVTAETALPMPLLSCCPC